MLVLVAAVPACAQTDWTPLFDGKTLGDWRSTPFKESAGARVENGAIVLDAGKPMTGITWSGAQFPKTGYELRFEAQRSRGGDFFASATFPVKDSFCTLVTGGWGGDIVGLSSLDGWDASDNETRHYYTFETGKWYAFRVRVTDDRIEVWINDKPLIDVVITGREISLRPGDTRLTAPLGFMSYWTTGKLQKIEYRTLGKK